MLVGIRMDMKSYDMFLVFIFYIVLLCRCVKY